MRRPRPLDADRFVLAAEQAVDAGLLRFRVGEDEPSSDLDVEVDLDAVAEIVAVLGRPVVARDPDTGSPEAGAPGG